ncbi:hypothetical protein FPZ12_029465 [Amycolatopsis acidicola]|uniref:Uncharacterized protein n=1 Tax=Amycolatopsis acidicola TaxID=2596893 RepID=A0A5N0UTY5_9PSEU|nr:hypothetical protein [Amycolatopsis acidicola]KAA9155526.1 hypothetical protein FPZ12_029465 [Amycolatopsis acidicola]
MSLFEATDGDRRRQQRENLAGLTKLVELGAKRKLSPLTWRLPDGYGTLSGNVETIPRAAQHPRDTFKAWHDAIAALPRVEPGKLGFRRDGAPRAEGTRDGKTWLIAVFKLPLAKQGSWPCCEFVIQAEWYEDELAEAAG